MRTENIAESILHELWQEHSKYLIAQPLLSDGTPFTIINSGTYNDRSAGPDFTEAEIAVDGLRILGDIELHRSLKDWDHHGHTGDPNYSQVILHVVLDADLEELEQADPKIPVCVLRDNFSFDQRTFWRELIERKYARSPELPCFPHNLSVPLKLKYKLIEQMAQSRLDERVGRIVSAEEIFSDELLLERVYELVCDALGYSENRVPMVKLSQALPRSLLQQIRRNEPSNDLLKYFEALFFGTAGLLVKPSAEYNDDVNEYVIDLAARWEALKIDYQITEILSEYDWAFFRVRPLNTPYRRIAAAALLAFRFFSRQDFDISEELDLEIGGLPFWEMHTSFKHALDAPHLLVGSERLNAIVVNVTLPARIAQIESQAMRNSLDLNKIKSVSKELRKEWSEFPSRSSAQYLRVIEQELLEGESASTTEQEQGALFLHRNYCTALRCSECPVGNRLILHGWKPLR
ncbi:MAG: DUF2851 family protein [bacterium]